MRHLLNKDSVTGPGTIYTTHRQQLTPDMRFTCDGMITKWIIGADWHQDDNDDRSPELQIWRNRGDGMYHKINGTFIVSPEESDDRIYE